MHETHTKITYQEYKKFNNALFLRSFFKIFIPLLIIEFILVLILVLIFDLMQFVIDNIVGFLIGALLGCTITILLAFIVRNIRVRQSYNSNKMLRNKEVKILFHKDAVEVKSQNSNGVVKYADLYKIIETKTNFYLMAAENQGTIIVKANCDKKLIDFIRNLV